MYADKDLLIADYLPEAKSTLEKDAIGRILTSVSAFVDTYCKRTPGFFNPAAANATERRVRGEGSRFLRLPVHVAGSVEQVTLNGTVINTADYYESEKNGWLYLENNSFIPEWCAEIIYKVKASWGYAETPADLQEAVRLTVLRIWETQKGTLGQITPGAFVVERALAPFAKEVLDKYKRREFEI
jgi:hypothetical protein